MNLHAYERIHLGLFVLLRLLCFLFSGRLYLYASRSTHGLSENAEDNFLVFFTGGYWQQLLYFLLLPRKKRQSLPLARKKNNKQTKQINLKILCYRMLVIGPIGLETHQFVLTTMEHYQFYIGRVICI